MKVWRSGVARQWTMFIGAVFFMVSDALIGINMFYAPVPHHQVTNFVFVSRKIQNCHTDPFFLPLYYVNYLFLPVSPPSAGPDHVDISHCTASDSDVCYEGKTREQEED